MENPDRQWVVGRGWWITACSSGSSTGPVVSLQSSEGRTDLGRELGELLMYDGPDEFDVDAHVVVDNLIPHPCNLAPRNTRSGCANFCRQVFHGFADDLDPPDHRVLQLLVPAELDEVDSRNVRSGQLDALEDVRQVELGSRGLHRILISS